MNPKRVGFIWGASLCAIIELIIGLAVLGISFYSLLSRVRHIPIPVIDTWRVLLVELIFWSATFSFVCLFTIWAVLQARQKSKSVAIFVILGHIFGMIGGIYLTLNLDSLFRTPAITPTELTHLTNEIIQTARLDHHNLEYIPLWLDLIQNKSSHCCGIRTYHDWEGFWSPLKETYPKSCCRHEKPNCIRVTREVIYPDILDNNIKKNGGCYRDIMTKVDSLLLESRKLSSVLTAAIGVTLSAVGALYLVVFCLKKPPRNPDDEDEDDDDDNDIPKFPPDALSWRNLEFYRVLVRGKKKPKMVDNMIFDSGLDSIDPTPGTSTNFQQPTTEPINIQQEQPVQETIVEYRVNVLSSSTLVPQPPTPDPTPAPQSQFFQEVTDLTTNPIDSVAVASVTQDTDDGIETRNRTHLRLLGKKGRHRHRHRKDSQENDIINDTQLAQN